MIARPSADGSFAYHLNVELTYGDTGLVRASSSPRGGDGTLITVLELQRGRSETLMALTPRKPEVACNVVDGLSDREIAQRPFLSGGICGPGRSYRDVEELLAERGIEVDHVTIHRWVRRFTPLLADAARFARHRVGDRWHVEETYVKVAGRWCTSIGRSTSSGRSSTCTRPPAGTARRPPVRPAGQNQRWHGAV